MFQGRSVGGRSLEAVGQARRMGAAELTPAILPKSGLFRPKALILVLSSYAPGVPSGKEQGMNAYFPHFFDFACLAASLALFLGYNLYIGRKLKANPLYTIQGVSETARREWADGVMRAGDGILAVQTLRNSTMVASFMASTSTLLALGVLSLSAQAEDMALTWHVLNLFGATGQGMLMIKILALMLDLFFAFFCFSSSIRLYNHVGFMINTCKEEVARDVKIAFVTAHLNSAAHQFHTGMRAFYFMVPLIFWVFGSVFLVLATAAMIAVVHVLDKTPHASSALLPRRPS